MRIITRLTQRALAQRSGTAQSVVARTESGVASPTIETMQRLLAAAGFELELHATPAPVLDRQVLDDVSRILRLTPEERLREVANVSRLFTSARRVR